MYLWVIKQMVPHTMSLSSPVSGLVRLIHREHSLWFVFEWWTTPEHRIKVLHAAG